MTAGDWILTGDIVTGDMLRWTEAVWPPYKPRGRFGRKPPKPLGHRTITAKVVKESYGAAKQQHTFTLVVIAAEGKDAPEVGAKILRKGRNLYGNDCERQVWVDERDRETVASEKHERGHQARKARNARRLDAEMLRDYEATY